MRPTQSHERDWRKSSHSSWAENCVEVASREGHIALRDSKEPEGPVLTVSPTAFTTFVDSLR